MVGLVSNVNDQTGLRKQFATMGHSRRKVSL